MHLLCTICTPFHVWTNSWTKWQTRRFFLHFTLSPYSRDCQRRWTENSALVTPWTIPAHPGAISIENWPWRPRRAVYNSISPIQCQLMLVYLNQTVIFSRSAKAHMPHVQNVVRVVCKAEVKMIMKKYKFISTMISWQGIVRPEQLHVMQHTVNRLKGCRLCVAVTKFVT